MSAQVVFDCDDLKKEIFSFCLPQYPVITKKMIDDEIIDFKGKLEELSGAARRGPRLASGSG